MLRKLWGPDGGYVVYLLFVAFELWAVPQVFSLGIDASVSVVGLLGVIAGWASAGAMAGALHGLGQRLLGSRRVVLLVVECALLVLFAVAFSYVRFGSASVRWYVIAASGFIILGPVLSVALTSQGRASPYLRIHVLLTVIASITFVVLVSLNALHLFPRWRREVASVSATGFLLCQVASVRDWLSQNVRRFAAVAVFGAAMWVTSAWVSPDSRYRATALALRHLDFGSPNDISIWYRNARDVLSGLGGPGNPTSERSLERGRHQELTSIRPSSGNVLLIVVDTLRADFYLRNSGEFEARYPNLAQLRSEVCIYPKVWAGANSTHLALPALLNGTFAFDTQAEPALVTLSKAMNARLRVFAELFGDFAVKYAGIESEKGIGAESVTNEVIAKLKVDAESGSRWLYYVHYMDVHLRLDAADWFALAGGADRARERYIREVQRVDHGIGRITAELKRSGMWNDTVLVLTADHGELLNELGFTMHGGPVLEAAARVPFFLKSKRNHCPYQTLPLSSLDIYPMILEEVGLTRKNDPDDLTWPPVATRALVTYSHLGRKDFAIIADDRKYLFDSVGRLIEVTGVDFNTQENRNVIVSGDFERAARLRSALPRLMSRWMPIAPIRPR